MRRLFFFLLGFSFSFILLITCSYAVESNICSTTGKCGYWYCNSPIYGGAAASGVAIWNIDNCGVKTLSSTTSGDWCYQSCVYVTFLDGSNNTSTTSVSFTAHGLCSQADERYSSHSPPLSPTLPDCSNCNDTDSDGVCDQCDIAPNDSSLGKTGYVKGYYEYNGKIVAGLTSFSPENSTYDAMEIYENDPEIPGYVLGLGMPTYINESDFLAGGGKFVALQKPEQTYEMSCPAVHSLDQCGQIECEIKPVGSSATNELPNNGKGETEVAETEQKAEDAGMLDLDKTCDELRSKCASSCGGSTNIQNFACSENEHMVCQCLSNGTWELAKDWSEVGKQITITETTTVPSYGDGDSPEGGGNTTSVSGSPDGSLTGSYGYVEGNINYDTLSSHFSQFNSKFPFSLRSTLGSIYSDFKGTGAAPVYTYSVYGKTVTIDLAAWNDIAKMIRSFFALGITLSTIVLLIYLYVGIDLRGK